MTRGIPLSKGRVAIVDTADFEWLSQWRWHARSHRDGTPYAARNGRVVDGCRGQIIFMHNQIMQPPAGMAVDHINRDKLDNRRSNLRICTRAQNQANCERRVKAAPYRGIRSVNKGTRWAAQIGANGAHHYLGCYPTMEDAARAYDEAALRLHGEFATLNFPEDR